MDYAGTLRIALQALLRNRSRSILTMLGVVIGVAAVIVTVAIGTGARAQVAASINGLGSNLLILLPGSVSAGGARSGTGGSSTLTIDDGLALAKLPTVAAVSPAVNVRTQVVGNGNNWQTTVTGVSPSYTYIRSWPLAEGAFFTQRDVDATAKVAVIGQRIVENIFPDGRDPLGATILIRNVPFVVTGVLSPKGQSGVGQDQDDVILIPYTSALQRLTGQVNLSSMQISADDPADIDATQTAAEALLRARHRLKPGEDDDFTLRNLQDIADTASSTGTVLQLLLSGVAAVSLLVGGIGIMNIMLVSVTERTREIGLRVALGARRSVILTQFLVEAIVLSFAGGVIGALFGLGGAALITTLSHWPVVVPPVAVIASVGFSGLVGVFFGYYPATKAAKLDPIAALRFE